MKTAFRPAFAAALVALLASAGAQAQTAVVELFTSQGCASCPPADAILVELAEDPDILALTLPVDYWDYLGWVDTLADPAHTARQRGYAEARGDRMVFTPQMVVNGAVACVGSKRHEVSAAIETARTHPPAVPVSVEVAAGVADIRVGAGVAAPAEVWLLAVDRALEVAIGRGENSGRHAHYANVVRGIVRVGAWTGEVAQYSHPLAAEGDFHVVLVQRSEAGRPGPILGVARSDAR